MFNREALRGAVRRAIEEHRAAYDRERSRLAQQLESSKQQWLRDHRDAWHDATVKIVKKLGKDEPITEKDLPRGRGFHYLSLYEPPRIPSSKEYEAPADLLAFAALLDVVTDEKISTNALKDLGFGQRALGSIIPYLRPGAQGNQ
jgi:hypothetical protein